ncbi:DUF4148 domain-containing protein [Ramlibacter sp. AN1133]|uniref:DUF4148 domain-containing protein n=1 Tax=Ramlibacter sp. AN1133 TaxID=3133429 RepID=UPI0030BC723C
MNRHFQHSLFAFVAACALNAHAESPMPSSDAFVSTKTRAAVQAELAAFRQSGVNPWSVSYDPLRSFNGSASREQVKADYLAAREQVQAFAGEDSGSAWLARRVVPASSALVQLRGLEN